MTRLERTLMLTHLTAYVRAHRKALAGAVSTAVAAYSLQIANGAHAVDWHPILAAVIAGIVGGGAVHQATNEVTAGSPTTPHAPPPTG